MPQDDDIRLLRRAITALHALILKRGDEVQQAAAWAILDELRRTADAVVPLKKKPDVRESMQ